MWYIIGVVVLVVVIAVIAKARRTDGSASVKPSVDDSSDVGEEPKDEVATDDYDECRCGSPGGSCCWK